MAKSYIGHYDCKGQKEHISAGQYSIEKHGSKYLILKMGSGSPEVAIDNIFTQQSAYDSLLENFETVTKQEIS